MTISMEQSKKRLTRLWFGWSGLLFVILLGQSLMGNYGYEWADWDAAWGWFVPAICPTLSLIAGVLVVDSQRQGVDQRQVGRDLFWLTFGVSMFYLATVSAAICAQPFVPLPELELLERIAFPMGALQGLVAALLGAFFVKAESQAEPEAGSEEDAARREDGERGQSSPK